MAKRKSRSSATKSQAGSGDGSAPSKLIGSKASKKRNATSKALSGLEKQSTAIPGDGGSGGSDAEGEGRQPLPDLAHAGDASENGIGEMAGCGLQQSDGGDAGEGRVGAAEAGEGIQEDEEDAVEDLLQVDLEEPSHGCRALQDFSALPLKPDHTNRPLWVCPDGTIFLETYSPIYKQAYDFLIAVAEPCSRPAGVHEYQLTEHSLYAATSAGLETSAIISVLNRLSKVDLSADVCAFIRKSTTNYGKVKLVLYRARFFAESPDSGILRELMGDPTIQEAMAAPTAELIKGRRLRDLAAADLALTGIKEDVDMDLGGEASCGERARGEAEGATHERRGGGQVVGPAGWRRGEGGADEEVGEEEMEALLEAEAAASRAQAEDDDPLEEELEAAFGAPPPINWQPRPFRVPVPSSGRKGPTQATPNPPRAAGLDEPEEGEEADQDVYSFELRSECVDRVRERCLPSGLNYPMLEEYDFRNDTANPDVTHLDLKPTVRHRPYQEKSLARMFGNGRARSGIIVLPCGAGKTLVGISAAQRVRKSCLCLATNAVSVDQWHAEFKRWTTLEDHQLTRLTSSIREPLPEGGQLDVCITTYSMVAFTGRRSEQSKKIMEAITRQEWGLLLMDEVHVVPAQMFRKVVGIIKSHCKLGLTATLVREDSLISDLNFLIGPKLYEANWLDLTRDGHIASVQSNEVWCPMPREYLREYLKPANAPRRQLLYCLNPYKFQACQFLVDYHERIRGDKVIVFSDNLFALREYATRLKRPFICGSTSHADRTRILYNFKNNPQVNTIFLSKVGDNSIDVPEANVLLQISSHAGSRRQEAQRLGRILRAKGVKPGAKVEGSEEHNAFFYTLVSQDTQEMYYSAKRQKFLVDQGYSFKVVTNLLDGAEASHLQLSTMDEQLNLLAKILSIGMEEELAEEAAEEVAARGPPAPAAARRVVSSLSALSGADGRVYMEYSTTTNPAQNPPSNPRRS